MSDSDRSHRRHKRSLSTDKNSTRRIALPGASHPADILQPTQASSPRQLKGILRSSGTSRKKKSKYRVSFVEKVTVINPTVSRANSLTSSKKQGHGVHHPRPASPETSGENSSSKSPGTPHRLEGAEASPPKPSRPLNEEEASPMSSPRGETANPKPGGALYIPPLEIQTQLNDPDKERSLQSKLARQLSPRHLLEKMEASRSMPDLYHMPDEEDGVEYAPLHEDSMLQSPRRRVVRRKKSKVDLNLNRDIARLERQKLRIETEEAEQQKALELEEEIQAKRRKLMQNVRLLAERKKRREKIDNKRTYPDLLGSSEQEELLKKMENFHVAPVSASILLGTLCGPNMNENLRQYKDIACARTVSTYPVLPGRGRAGDPICDYFYLRVFEDCALLVLSDGCGWGDKPKDAAKDAATHFLHYLQERLQVVDHSNRAGYFILRAMAAAHYSIVKTAQSTGKNVWDAGTATLLGGVLLPARVLSSGKLKPVKGEFRLEECKMRDFRFKDIRFQRESPREGELSPGRKTQSSPGRAETVLSSSPSALDGGEGQHQSVSNGVETPKPKDKSRRLSAPPVVVPNNEISQFQEDSAPASPHLNSSSPKPAAAKTTSPRRVLMPSKSFTEVDSPKKRKGKLRRMFSRKGNQMTVAPLHAEEEAPLSSEKSPTTAKKERHKVKSSKRKVKRRSASSGSSNEDDVASGYSSDSAMNMNAGRKSKGKVYLSESDGELEPPHSPSKRGENDDSRVMFADNPKQRRTQATHEDVTVEDIPSTFRPQPPPTPLITPSAGGGGRGGATPSPIAELPAPAASPRVENAGDDEGVKRSPICNGSASAPASPLRKEAHSDGEEEVVIAGVGEMLREPQISRAEGNDADPSAGDLATASVNPDLPRPLLVLPELYKIAQDHWDPRKRRLSVSAHIEHMEANVEYQSRLSEVTQSRNLHDKEQLAHVPNVVASAHPDRHSRDIREGTIRQIRGRFNTVSVPSSAGIIMDTRRQGPLQPQVPVRYKVSQETPGRRRPLNDPDEGSFPSSSLGSPPSPSDGSVDGNPTKRGKVKPATEKSKMERETRESDVHANQSTPSKPSRPSRAAEREIPVHQTNGVQPQNPSKAKREDDSGSEDLSPPPTPDATETTEALLKPEFSLTVKDDTFAFEEGHNLTLMEKVEIVRQKQRKRREEKRKRKRQWLFVFGNVGDCKAFVWKRSSRKVRDITLDNRTQTMTMDARDCGGRLGPHIEEGKPDLRNLIVLVHQVEDGDIIMLASDGVHDNLDPQLLGLQPSDVGCEDAKDWEVMEAERREEVKCQFRENLLAQLVGDEIEVDICALNTRIIEHCLETTQASRDFMQQQPDEELPPDYVKYPGKMDHTSLVIFVVGSADGRLKEGMPAMPASRALSM